MLFYTLLHFILLLYYTILYYTILYYTSLYYTVIYYNILYFTHLTHLHSYFRWWIEIILKVDLGANTKTQRTCLSRMVNFRFPVEVWWQLFRHLELLVDLLVAKDYLRLPRSFRLSGWLVAEETPRVAQGTLA